MLTRWWHSSILVSSTDLIRTLSLLLFSYLTDCRGRRSRAARPSEASNKLPPLPSSLNLNAVSLSLCLLPHFNFWHPFPIFLSSLSLACRLFSLSRSFLSCPAWPCVHLPLSKEVSVDSTAHTHEHKLLHTHLAVAGFHHFCWELKKKKRKVRVCVCACVGVTKSFRVGEDEDGPGLQLQTQRG